MAKNAPREGEEQTNEQVNTAAKKKDPNLPERLVRDFLDAKLTGGTGGVDFYNRAKTDKCASALEEFKTYYQERPEGSDPESAQTIDNIKKEFLYREMIRTGVTFESKRKTVLEVLSKEFDLPNDTTKLRKQIDKLPREQLDAYLRDKTKRRALVNGVFVGQEVFEHDLIAQLEQMLGRKNLTEKQKASMAQVFSSPNIERQDMDEVLGLFSDLEEKQLIIKFFLPSVTLWELQEAGVLTEEQVQTAIRRSIEEHRLGADFPLSDAEVEKVVHDVDTRDITIVTALFPLEVVDAVLKSTDCKNTIRWTLEDVNKERREEIRAESNIWLEPNDEGELLPSFQEKLKKELGVGNAGLFQEGNFIHGKTILPDGTTQSFYFAIDTIEDDPRVRGVQDRASGAVITLKNVLTADGKINTHWQKNPGEKYTYSEMFAIIQEAQGQAKKGAGQFALSTPSDMQSAIAHGTVEQKTLRSDLDTVEELRSAIDEVDKSWASCGLDEGIGLQFGNPTDTNFWIYTVHSVNEKNRTVTVLNWDNSKEDISFEHLFDAFEAKKLSRLPKIDSPETFLATLQAHGDKKDKFKDIVYDGKRGFIPQDKKSDQDFPSVVQFVGGKETISLFGGADPMKHGWDRGVWTEEEKKDKNGNTQRVGKYDKNARHYAGSWNALYVDFLQTKAVPKITTVPLKAIEKSGKEMHDHGGFLSVAKGFLANPSIHDMGMAVKNIFSMFKHTLEEGSKLEAAKFQLAMGKRLGFTDAMMRELRTNVYKSTRELMENLIKEWSTLSAGERSAEVAHILENPRSTDYELQAATFVMLKKHGTLYSGGSLVKHQGSFKFFERISGQKYDPNSALVQMLRKKMENEGLLFREEYLIQMYFKHYGGKDGGYLYDSGLWGQVRDNWREGINSETETGKKQAEWMKHDLSAMHKLFIGKLMWGEVAQAIGIMPVIWEKGSSNGADMHMPAIYLALSGIPKTLHTQQISPLYNALMSSGHPYPALAFLRSEEHAELFQRIMKSLCEDNPEMKASYAAVEEARWKNNLPETVVAIGSFWGKYGSTLHAKLCMSQDPEILYRAKTDPDSQAYVERLRADTGNCAFNKDEVGEGTYQFSHSSTIWNARACLHRNLKIHSTSGVLNIDDEASKMAWESFIEAIQNVKKIHVTDDPDKNRTFQEERYGEYYKAFNGMIRNVPAKQLPTLKDEWYMKELDKLGFSVPVTQQESDFETPAYKAQIAEDFEAYMSGGRAMKQTDKVATHASDILKQTGYANSRAANDEGSEKRAKVA